MTFLEKVEQFSANAHLPVGIFVFLVGCGMEWYHHLDASFVAFTTTVLGFLGAHAWIKEPDRGTPEPPKKEQ